MPVSDTRVTSASVWLVAMWWHRRNTYFQNKMFAKMFAVRGWRDSSPTGDSQWWFAFFLLQFPTCCRFVEIDALVSSPTFAWASFICTRSSAASRYFRLPRAATVFLGAGGAGDAPARLAPSAGCHSSRSSRGTPEKCATRARRWRETPAFTKKVRSIISVFSVCLCSCVGTRSGSFFTAAVG